MMKFTLCNVMLTEMQNRQPNFKPNPEEDSIISGFKASVSAAIKNGVKALERAETHAAEPSANYLTTTAFGKSSSGFAQAP